MKDAPEEIGRAVHDLEHPSDDICVRCPGPLSCISIVVSYADQAYEQCSSTLIGKAWSEVSKEISKRLGTNAVLVNRGKENKTRTLKSGTPPNYYEVSTSDIASTMLAYCWLSLVTIGGIVYELRGLPIGGVLSGVALSILLARFELRARKGPERFRSMGFQ
eukprot:325526-Pyramimonas_sp.AAC.1